MKGLPTVLLALPSRRDIEHWRELLGEAATVVGEAASLKEAQRALIRYRPQVAVMALRMPDGEALGLLGDRSLRGKTQYVLLAEDPTPEDYRRAMRAGASDLIGAPVSPGEVLDTIRRLAAGDVWEREGRIVTVFSTKGGVGKTTLAANLAAELVGRTQSQVALVDLDLEFGNLAAFFGAVPTLSSADLCRRTGAFSLTQIQETMTFEATLGLPILASPPTPDLASVVDGDAKKEAGRNYVQEILARLKAGYDYVVVDTASRFSESVITALDGADVILMLTAPDIPALQSTAKGLNVMVERLGYSEEKLKLVLNRSNAAIGLLAEDMSRFLHYPISFHLPSDGDTAVRACNTGLPMVRRRGRSPLVRAIREVARFVSAPGKEAAPRQGRHFPAGR